MLLPTLPHPSGKSENIPEAKRMLQLRSKANSDANKGVYGGEAGAGAASESLHVSNYSY